MDILYNFKRYNTPRFGVFLHDTNVYKLPIGWLQDEKTSKIIGETDEWYVTHLQEGGHGEWVGKIVIQRKYILPIGIHKSRLVRWTSGQLTLFD